MIRPQLKHAGQHRVQTPSGEIAFDLFTSRRKTVTLRVLADGQVRIDAPSRASLKQIVEFVRQKAAWIVRHRQHLSERHAARPQRRYADGELWPYLGRELPLRLTRGEREGVTLAEDAIVVTAADPTRLEALLKAWYLREAKRVFAERLKAVAPCVASLNITPPDKLTVRFMTSKWGSCSSRGRVTLNARMVQLDPILLDYVIVHELCHLREMNHSPRYYALLDAAMPGWKAYRKALRALHTTF
jgi:predicted metal-dependent hydrolase